MICGESTGNLCLVMAGPGTIYFGNGKSPVSQAYLLRSRASIYEPRHGDFNVHFVGTLQVNLVGDGPRSVELGVCGLLLLGTMRREVMSLDVYLTEIKPIEVYSANITHNLHAMAEEAGLYKLIWRPDEVGILKADQLILALRAGLSLLKNDPARFQKFNPPNGWGTYEGFVCFVEQYLKACEEHPNADVRVSR